MAASRPRKRGLSWEERSEALEELADLVKQPGAVKRHAAEAVARKYGGLCAASLLHALRRHHGDATPSNF